MTSHVAITPYMLTDVGVIRKRCQSFKKHLPNVKLYYAIKAYSDIKVLLAVEDIVDGFDAASIGEINTLLNLGVDAKRIAYSNPVKPIEAISEAVHRGVDKFAFQSREELHKLAICAQGTKVYVRVKMDDSHSAVPLSAKYGCRPEEAVDLLQYAQELGLEPIGVTFHVGSQQLGLEPWSRAIERSQMIINDARNRGIKCDMINLGGGLPVKYEADDPDFPEVAKVINNALKKGADLQYMAEPGRFIVADSSVIVSSVIGKEERDGRSWLFIDVGLFQAFVGTMRFDTFPYPPYVASRAKNKTEAPATMKKYILTGPTCDSQDIIMLEAELPEDLQVGDRIAFPKVGAYTIVYGTDFNGFKIPARFFIDSTKKS